jgi:hypothetical protein
VPPLASPDASSDPHWPTFERQRVGECVEHTPLHCATSFLDRVPTERASVAEGIGTHHGQFGALSQHSASASEDGSRVEGVPGVTNHCDVASKSLISRRLSRRFL